MTTKTNKNTKALDNNKRELTDKDIKFFDKVDHLRKVRNSKEELYNYIKENITKITIDDFNPSTDKLSIITKNNRVEGFYISMEEVKYLPLDVRLILFTMLDASGCKNSNKQKR